ncbi:hypothetical protein CW745_04005 [Psychromonas sp. psych-6C06]|uniref:hypothetical protein n=1 Tax=Psychromonas sp. psych-6C06 TaxID=2058089 RepID=UPI000C32A538|nr:hypothetical protein [Psychromonas sp. psych-6C06]PKF62593.1 hypothetical protein CW745_04005 [Psychromonas sp. psych-6C06]
MKILLTLFSFWMFLFSPAMMAVNLTPSTGMAEHHMGSKTESTKQPCLDEKQCIALSLQCCANGAPSFYFLPKITNVSHFSSYQLNAYSDISLSPRPAVNLRRFRPPIV